jgi:hypothetical protein
LASETGGTGGTEEGSTGETMPLAGMSEGALHPPSEAEVLTQPGPQVEGRRTQLRIVRENIHSLSKDVGSFRKSHEASTKKLEKQVATLRSELAAFKSNIAKDAARSRAKQEATLSKILAKVSAKPSKPARRSKKQ